MKVDISKWADGIARPMNFINKLYSMPYNRFMQRVETPGNLDKVITIDHETWVFWMYPPSMMVGMHTRIRKNGFK